MYDTVISHILFGSGIFGVDFETLDYCYRVAGSDRWVSPEGGVLYMRILEKGVKGKRFHILFVIGIFGYDFETLDDGGKEDEGA